MKSTTAIVKSEHLHLCSLPGNRIVARSALANMPSKAGTASLTGKPKGNEWIMAQ